jgi:putative DNA primase/helicase
MATVTNGSEWPCGEGRAPQGNVLLLTAEDAPDDTVIPRLIAAGAALDRVEIVQMVRTGNKKRMFSLVTDLELLRRKVAEVGDVRLILIDPVSAYLGHGKIDSFRGTDVRAMFGPVADLAAELKIAIIGIMHFNKKTDVTNVLLRISDSLAFGAASRHVYGVINDAANERKLLVKGKNNHAPHNQKALAYHFGTRLVGRDPETGKEIWAPHILWEPRQVDVTATEAMQAASENKAPAARDEAKKFLRELLANGPVVVSEVEDAAKGHGIGWRTVERAKRELDIIVAKDGYQGRWVWRLPDRSSSPYWSD